MAQAPETHSDPIVRDLRIIRRLNWSRPDGFRALETLLTHPLVVALAQEPKEDQQLVEALEAILKKVVVQIAAAEGPEPPFGRSVATASTALLRLSPEFSRMSLEEIRSHVAESWEKKGGGRVSADGFRLHLEVPGVYEPFAAEFRRFAREHPGAHPERRLSAAERDLSPVADALAEMEEERHRERLSHIQDGVLKIRSEEEMFKVLVILTTTAKRELVAVDHVDVAEWFSSPGLHEYLRLQLSHASGKGGPKLERVRIVTDEELEEEGRKREQLDLFIKLHKEASAGLFLCHETSVKKLELGFSPQVGLLIADAGAAPAAVTGKLAGDGSIGRALVYVNRTDEVRQFEEEYRRLRMTAVEQDRELRDRLARVH